MSTNPIAVIGAGPVGLAAAAHLAERGLPFVVIEAGASVAASVRDWGHVRLFSPWRFNLDPAAVRLLGATGWQAPDPDAHPTGAALVSDYLQPLAALPSIAPHLRLGTQVVSVARLGLDRMQAQGREAVPFALRLLGAAGPVVLLARAVIDASGTWASPNPLGADGLFAPGEAEAATRIAYGLPDIGGADRAAHADARVAVVGAGHTAAHALLALDGVGASVTWVLRRGAPTRLFGGGAADGLPARGALGEAVRNLHGSGRLAVAEGFRIAAVETDTDGVHLLAVDGRRLGPFDRVVAATGQHADHGLAAALPLDLDPRIGCPRALGPLIDPERHACGTVEPHGWAVLRHPEPGYFTVGGKSYGRAPTFLMATGYEQVRSVVAHLADDRAAADTVSLQLPETGVCAAGALDGVACCAPKARPTQSACCGAAA